MSLAVPRRWLAGLALIALPVALAAQNVVTLRTDSTRRTIAPLSKLSVPVILDMSAAGGTNLVSLTTGVSFGTSRLTFDSVRTAGFGSLTPNTSSASSGNLTLAVFDATGTTATQVLATVYFTASPTPGGTTVGFAPTAAGSSAGANILSLVSTRSLDVCVAAGGKWGDVNGDSVATPLGDGSVNIIDAQQIARYSVSLAVSNRPGIVARGDVTADGSVNVIDAQQIARFSVGLNAAVRVNAVLFVPPAIAIVSVSQSSATLVAGQGLQLSATPRDVSNTAQNGCVPVAWTSSEDAVATVDSTGYVHAVSSGSATITASAGGMTTTSVITVASSTGVRLAVTSPVAASRWYVIADSGTLTSPQVSKFGGNNRRFDTLLVSLPAGSGYRLRLVVADSASMKPDVSPLVAAGGRISGVSVVAGSLTPQSVAATALSVVVTIPNTVELGGAVPVDLTLTDPSQVLSAWNSFASVYFGTSSWMMDGGGLSTQLFSPTQPTPTSIRWNTGSAVVPSSAGTLVSQARFNTWIVGQEFNFYSPSLQLGQPLRITAVVIPTTGVRLAVTSPVAASRWYVVADSGALVSPQLSKFHASNRRVDTLLVSLPAGSGYRLRLLAVDSASTLPDSAPLVTAGGRISGVSVAAGALTPRLVEATALSAVVTMPDTVAVGGSVPIDLTLTDPSQVLSATRECAYFYSGITSWAKDESGSSSTSLCTRTTPSSTTVRYTGSAIAPLAMDTLYSQLRVVNWVSWQWFYFYVPSRQLGQPLRRTVATSATTGVRLAVTSPRAASRWYVVADSGTLTSPRVSRFDGNNRRVDTLLVSLPEGSGYRLRLLVADSASAYPDAAPLVTAGGRVSGVSVVAGSLTSRSVAATALSAVVTMPDTLAVGGAVPVELTLTDPSQVLSTTTEVAYFNYGTSPGTTEGDVGARIGPSGGYLGGPTVRTANTLTYNWSAIAPSSPSTLFSQIEVSNSIAGQQFHFYVPSRQLGQSLRSTPVVTTTMGVRLALTSPVAASRWYVVADSGALASPRVSRFPGNNRRVDTLLVSLPAGSGYRLRLLVADSASTSPDQDPLVTAGARISGISVAPGSLTAQSVAATALSATVTMPDTVAVNGAVPISLNLTDPSRVLYADDVGFRYCAQFLFDTAVWEGPPGWGGDGGGHWARLCTMTEVNQTTIRYSGAAIAPPAPGMIYSQMRVLNWVAGQSFHFYVPSRQLGQLLRTTAVVNPSTGLRLAVTSPRPASRWYVVADSGTLASPQVSRFPGNFRRVDTLAVQLPAGSGYRLRLVVADSASSSPDDYPLATAGGRISGVSVMPGSMSTETIAATALSAVVNLPDTVVVGDSVSVDLTLTDPSQVLSANSIYCALVYFGTASWATDPVGGSYPGLCTLTTPTKTTIRYRGSIVAPSSAGVMFSQVLVKSAFADEPPTTGGEGFQFYVPSLQLGQPLRTTIVRDSSVASITVAPASPILVVGQTMQLTTTARDSGNIVVAGGGFAWSSSNPAVATVSASGQVTAVSTGTATISATAGGVLTTTTVTVSGSFNVGSETSALGRGTVRPRNASRTERVLTP